ncbi:YrrC family ATP-dependent DNA helicase [Cyanobium gracile]|uniref:ATP-dependent RecD2 DNA helicase OB-fold domain-containing protein n=1 Tax=Cyanobium gracile (strain ATCC 27147 / PCC 6307) TaxID=292564 RepID=K9P999_CYAGP|nr:hypothetical protein [Cyanobium gracile]AFY29700.1 hypothetical protein Cyagr_2596 [Cyanobium gracile PCC 6307]
MATSLPMSSSHQPRRYRLVDHHGQPHLELDEHFESIEDAWAFATDWWQQQQPAGAPETQVGLGLEVSTENVFRVLCIKARGHRDLVTLVGHAAEISANEWVTVSRTWVCSHEHGQQFKASYLRASAPTTAEGIEKYLGSGMIRGIGPTYDGDTLAAEPAIFLPTLL